MNRRAFLRTGASSAALLLGSPVWGATAERADKRIPDEAILSQAADRIDRHRKGDATILVEDSKGNRMPGLKVHVQQTRHDFLFGCNLFNWGRCGDPDREEQYRQRFAGLLNFATLGFYWRVYELQRGKPDYEYTDRVAEWARANHITLKGHPLVWDHPAGSPSWLPDGHAEIARLSDRRVRDVISRFRGKIDVWDVVNEATHLPDHVNKTKMAEWGAALGPVPYIAEALKTARSANPGALLLVNDYRIDKHYYELLDKQRVDGVPAFDAIGIQSHMHDGSWPLEKVWNVCDTYAKLGRPVHFTETTLVSGPRLGEGENWGPTTAQAEAKQAEAAADFYTAVFAHPGVRALTWWDFSDYHAWQRAAAGWLRPDMSPKPVYDRLKDLIKRQWWTTLDSRTDPQGTFSARGFYGSYEITVEPPNAAPITRQFQWSSGQPMQFNFRI